MTHLSAGAGTKVFLVLFLQKKNKNSSPRKTPQEAVPSGVSLRVRDGFRSS
jgi:hypothetical protein